MGQHAGNLAVAPIAGNNAALNVTAGWIEIAGELQVGAAGQGAVNHAGGAVAARGITLGGSGANGAGVYQLSGDGLLRVGQLAKGANGGAFEFTGGVLSADLVDFSLLNRGGSISPGEILGLTAVDGDLTMQSGSIDLQLAATAAGGFDRLAVSGVLAAAGTLNVTLLGSFVPAAGDSFDLLDFASASGAFALNLPALPAGLAWDAADLLTTGELAVAAAPVGDADFNGDGAVDGADFLAWQRGFGLSGQTTSGSGDANGDGVVDAADLAVWQSQFGNAVSSAPTNVPVPEPTVGWVFAPALLASITWRRRSRPTS